MRQLDLFDGAAQSLIDPKGRVCTDDEIDDTITLGDRRLGLRIELARHHDGRYMWGTSLHTPTGGCGYRVGPKWGHFADTIMDAARRARQEITEKAAHFADGKRVVQLLEQLTWNHQ